MPDKGGQRWTAAQAEAIGARDCSLLVSAGAGSGKTAVLVERIIRRLTDAADPVGLDGLLVVTFTDAAASQMRQRIGQALEKAVEREPDNAHLRRQLAGLNRSAISTLHSFCLAVLKRYFYMLGLDPAFRVAAEEEAALLQQEVLERILDDAWAAEQPDGPLTVLSDSLGGRGDEALAGLVQNLYGFLQSQAWPELWLERTLAAYREPAEDPRSWPWHPELEESLSLTLVSAAAALERGAALASLPDGPAAYRGLMQGLQRDVGELQRQLSSLEWEVLRRRWLTLAEAFGRLPAARGVAEEIRKEAGDAYREAKDAISRAAEDYFTREPAELRADLAAVAPSLDALAALVRQFGQAYRDMKAERALVDFNDLEHLALAVLHDGPPGELLPSPAARELRARFREVLVDEYQDVNGVQEAILTLVARAEEEQPNLFLVGDVKQSIYRFRLADPSLFLERRRRYAPSSGARERRVDLTANFRSRPGILHAVNYLFQQLFVPPVGEIDYAPEDELLPGREFPPGGEAPVEVYLVDQQEAAGKDRGGYGGPLEAEARLVARRIREMLQAGVMVADGQGGLRPLRYRDVVVLLRAVRGRAEVFLEVLHRYGIPAYADLGGGYFAAPEVEVMLSALRVVDNPRQDVALAAVLRSPLVGLNTEELAEIRLAAPREDFLDAVRAAAAGEGELAGRLQEFLARLERWRIMARRAPVADLLWQIYQETGYLAYVGGLPGGAQRQANLRALLDRAQQFARFVRHGLFRFLRFIERLQETEGDLGTARALGENEDVVRVMSVHRSKGLEFPVVVVAGLGQRFNRRDAQADVLPHARLGLAPLFTDPDQGVKYPTIAYLALRHRLDLEERAEEMRVLYVALTRAQERLLLVGSVPRREQAAIRWCRGLAASGRALPGDVLAGASSFLDWLGPALARHRDGAEIRAAAGAAETAGGEIFSHPACFTVRFTALPPATPERKAASGWLARAACLEPMAEPVDPALAVEVARRLSWRYPWAELSRHPAKLTVSELKRRPQEAEEDALLLFRPPALRQPRFRQAGETIGAAERGTITHQVLQHLDLARSPEEESLRAQVEEMVRREILTPEQAGVVDTASLARFLHSPLGRRLRAAPSAVRREVAFSLALPAREVYPETAGRPGEDEPVLLQGMVDCLVLEGDGAWLIDFKTDRVPAEGVAAAAERYRLQLEIYARAVQEVFHRPVREAYLYFLAPGAAWQVPLPEGGCPGAGALLE